LKGAMMFVVILEQTLTLPLIGRNPTRILAFLFSFSPPLKNTETRRISDEICALEIQF
jgi:hypothetical protein